MHLLDEVKKLVSSQWVSLVGGSDHDIPFSFGVCAFQSNIDSRYFYVATTAISTHLRNTALTGLLHDCCAVAS